MKLEHYLGIPVKVTEDGSYIVSNYDVAMMGGDAVKAAAYLLSCGGPNWLLQAVPQRFGDDWLFQR